MREANNTALTTYELGMMSGSLGSGLKTVAMKLESQITETNAWLDGYTVWLMSWFVNFPSTTSISLMKAFAKDVKEISDQEQITLTEWRALKKRGEGLITKWGAESKSWVSDYMLHDLGAAMVGVMGALDGRLGGRTLIALNGEVVELKKSLELKESLEADLVDLTVEVERYRLQVKRAKASVKRHVAVNNAQGVLIESLQENITEAIQAKVKVEGRFRKACAVVERLMQNQI